MSRLGPIHLAHNLRHTIGVFRIFRRIFIRPQAVRQIVVGIDRRDLVEQIDRRVLDLDRGGARFPTMRSRTPGADFALPPDQASWAL
jgi:hypothetical protein